MEGDDPETWNKEEPEEDRSDVGWTAQRGVEQGGGFVYLGLMAAEDGRLQVEVHRRIHANA